MAITASLDSRLLHETIDAARIHCYFRRINSTHSAMLSPYMDLITRLQEPP